jgi:hypothetical protein
MTTDSSQRTFLVQQAQQDVWYRSLLRELPSFKGHAVLPKPDRHVYFLLAVTPSHASRVKDVVEIMRNQTLVPDGVIVTIPKKYDRFAETFPMEELPKDALLKVNSIDTDAGLGAYSKYSGHSILGDQDIVIIGDDDMEYSRTFIEDFVSAVEDSESNTIFTGDVDVGFHGLMGYSGIACRAVLLRDLPTSVPRCCRVADDVVITQFADYRGIVKKLLLKRNGDISSRMSWDATSLYATHQHAWYRGDNHKCYYSLRFPWIAPLAENKWVPIFDVRFQFCVACLSLWIGYCFFIVQHKPSQKLFTSAEVLYK